MLVRTTKGNRISWWFHMFIINPRYYFACTNFIFVVILKIICSVRSFMQDSFPLTLLTWLMFSTGFFSKRLFPETTASMLLSKCFVDKADPSNLLFWMHRFDLMITKVWIFDTEINNLGMYLQVNYSFL